MPKDIKEPKIKILRPRIPKVCICPGCGLKQPFKNKGPYYKMAKDMNLDNPCLLKVKVVRTKCENPNCELKSFPLPVPGIEKYKRSTSRLI